jgi:thiol-disulfide isomerase/thioredoxin
MVESGLERAPGRGPGGTTVDGDQERAGQRDASGRAGQSDASERAGHSDAPERAGHSDAPERAGQSDAPERAGDADGADADASLGLVARLGLAIASPRWALSVAADRRHAGRSGSDLIAAIALVVLATQLRGLATAAWLGGAVAPGLGLRAGIRVLSGALTVELGLLALGALAVFALAGSRRSLGRAFDLACVAVLPVLFIDLTATVVVRAADVAVPVAVSWLLTAASYGWMGLVIALALGPARIAPLRAPAPPVEVVARARRLGWALAAVAAIGVAVHSVWIVKHLDLVKPMTTGEQAPAFVLAEIDPHGAPGAPFALSDTRGKVAVVDFWATWCRPCIAAMPELEKLARTHADVAVITINLDDPAAARALFNRRGYTIKLLADDGDTSQRYGVSAIPHTVVIDQRGIVREVIRGAGDLAAAVAAARSAD